MGELEVSHREAVAKAIYEGSMPGFNPAFPWEEYRLDPASQIVFNQADAAIKAYLASQPKPCAVVRWEGWSAYIGSVKVGDITKAADHDPLFGDWVWRIFDHEPWDGACFTEPEAMAAVSSAACEALGLGEMTAWQSIETAPKDGTRVMLGGRDWVGEGYYEAEDDHGWYEAGSHWTDAHDGSCLPTHWQPLPAAPSPPSLAGKDKG